MSFNTIQEFVEYSFNQFKDDIAISCGKTSLTYFELNQKADSIAKYLIQNDFKKESFIGVMMDDRVDFIVTVLGILKAGCVFVPLDPNHPLERLKYIIKTCNIAHLITDRANEEELTGTLDNITCHVFCKILESDNRYDSNITRDHSADDQIYIYFTSGTTGDPKAIIGKNKSLLQFIQWEIETFNVKQKIRTSQFTNVGFDAFLRDVFLPLCAGGTLCIPETDEILMNGDRLATWIIDEKIELIHCVPSLFYNLKSGSQNHTFGDLKFILLSGEKLNLDELAEWYHKQGERIKLINLYGPTETTMIKTMYEIQKSDLPRERIPIGKPIKGCRIIIFDQNMQPCDQGVIGEIYIRTPYRTYGYYNNNKLNQEKFIVNPYSNNSDDLIYRTGDLGRFLPDGNIDLLGRIDRQVKIRGNLVDLEEVESILLSDKRVKEVVVIKKELFSRTKIIIAFIVIKSNCIQVDDKYLFESLREYCSAKMVDYMVPSEFIKLDSIPRKENGKIDYNALTNEFYLNKSEHIGPKTYFEKKIHAVWAKIFGTNQISINESFFKIGGSSLNIMKLLSDINSYFDINISLGEIFNNLTIEKQANLVNKIIEEKSSRAKGSETGSLSEIFEREYIAFENNGIKLIAFPPLIGYGIAYKDLALYLSDYSLYAFNFIEGDQNIDKYISIITDVQKSGPYTLIGYSAGGNLAFQVAKEMQNRCYEVTDIVLIDSKYESTNISTDTVEITFNNMLKSLEDRSAYAEYFKMSDVRDRIKKKMFNSYSYHAQCKITGKVHANIHYILSDESDGVKEIQNWRQSTSRRLEVRQGRGEHNDMLSEEYNYELIRSIIEKI